MSDSPSPPPGWYPDTTAPGTERYWDGTAWTEHRRPVTAAPPPPPAPPPPAPPTPYGTPPKGSASYPAAGYPATGYPAGTKPDNYLVWTILSTILCCLPIGAVGIYFSTQVDKLWAQGDLAGAEDKARSARNLAIIAAVVSIVLLVVWVVFVAAFGTWNVEVNP